MAKVKQFLTMEICLGPAYGFLGGVTIPQQAIQDTGGLQRVDEEEWKARGIIECDAGVTHVGNLKSLTASKPMATETRE